MKIRRMLAAQAYLSQAHCALQNHQYLTLNPNGDKTPASSFLALFSQVFSHSANASASLP